LRVFYQVKDLSSFNQKSLEIQLIPLYSNKMVLFVFLMLEKQAQKSRSQEVPSGAILAPKSAKKYRF